jgi:hypothetical protein
VIRVWTKLLYGVGLLFLSALSPVYGVNLDSTVPGLVGPQAKLIISPSMPSDPSADGAVRYRYTINERGETTDIERIDEFRSSLFGTPTREAITKWKFKPATLNGVPVRWYDQYYGFVFILPTGRRPLSQPRFKAIADQIQALLDSKNFAGAKSRAESEIANASEIPKFIALQILLAHAELGLGRKTAALNALEHVQLLVVKEFLPAVRELFYLQADLGQYRAANSTYAQLQRLQNNLVAMKDSSVVPIGAAESSRMQDINRAVASELPIDVTGSITGSNWSYTPVRRAFSIADVKGSLDAVIARCHLMPPADAVTTQDVRIVLPPNAGECELEFQGTDGTELHIVEYANDQPSTAVSAP